MTRGSRCAMRWRNHDKKFPFCDAERESELVKKVFLTSSQTRSASLGSRLKKAACRCAHNLCANCAQIPHLRHVVCFVRRTRRRTKRIDTLFRRARRNAARFFDRPLPMFKCSVQCRLECRRHRSKRCAGDRGISEFHCGWSHRTGQARCQGPFQYLQPYRCPSGRQS